MDQPLGHTLFFPRILAALNVVQRPQHRLLAKFWLKNDVFDEKKRCVEVLNVPKRRPETARLTLPREFK